MVKNELCCVAGIGLISFVLLNDITMPVVKTSAVAMMNFFMIIIFIVS